MKKSVLMNCPILMITAFMLFMTAGLGYAVTTNYYVWRGNPSPAEPYTNWAGAADNIQAAVDRTLANDTVYVTNGIYDTGGKITPSYELTNRVYINKAITVRSMNGPGLTTIKGSEAPGGGMGTGAVRCVYIDNVAASLIGFTVTGGYTMTNGNYNYDRSGGGVFFYYNGVVSNCVISGNRAQQVGGGAYLFHGGTLNNCTIVSNTATLAGGGGVIADVGAINNCTLVGNRTEGLDGNGGGAALSGGATMNNCMVASNTAATWGGGVDFYKGGTLNNCTVVSNTANRQGGGLRFLGDTTGTGLVYNCIVWRNITTGGDSSSNIYLVTGASINYTCFGNITYHDAASTNYGSGNIVGDPMLTDIAAGNYRLSANSPCVNTGTNFSWMTDSTDVRSKDLDGHSRIDRFSGLVDMGAYEHINSGTIYGFH